MIEIKTESGFECKLPKDALDDIELWDILASEEYANEAYRNSALATHLLGDQKKTLYEHLRKIHGKVPVTAVEKELWDIFRSSGHKGKNS